MLYAITDRQLYAENKDDALAHLVELSSTWAANGASFIQVREKDLTACEQVELVRAVMRAVHSARSKTNAAKVLVNARVDVALAAGADGVHLPSRGDALTPQEVRNIFAAAGTLQPPVISISCHSLDEVKTASQRSPNCILFAPVFEKVIRQIEIAAVAKRNSDTAPRTVTGTGLALLAEACRVAAPVPVFALGGVTAENAADCARAGAAGIAAIRFLQQPPSQWKHLA